MFLKLHFKEHRIFLVLCINNQFLSIYGDSRKDIEDSRQSRMFWRKTIPKRQDKACNLCVPFVQPMHAPHVTYLHFFLFFFLFFGKLFSFFFFKKKISSFQEVFLASFGCLISKRSL